MYNKNMKLIYKNIHLDHLLYMYNTFKEERKYKFNEYYE